jgi:hypothetical protein
MTEITTRRDGFRRAGVSHHGTALHPEGAFTADELARLRAEPMLVVREIEQPPTMATSPRRRSPGSSSRSARHPTGRETGRPVIPSPAGPPPG